MILSYRMVSSLQEFGRMCQIFIITGLDWTLCLERRMTYGF